MCVNRWESHRWKAFLWHDEHGLDTIRASSWQSLSFLDVPSAVRGPANRSLLAL